MKKLLTLLLTLVMVICLVNLNVNHTKAEDNATPLTFTCVGDGCIIRFGWQSGDNVQYKTTGSVSEPADNWTSYTKNKEIYLLENGATISFRANNIKTSQDSTEHFVFSGDNMEASGDVTSLTNGIGGDAPLNIDNCYSYMFDNCEKLTTAPNLPSTTLSKECYKKMFCETSIVEAPVLPATTLSEGCYSYMFEGCNALTTLPALPAKNLIEDCYYSMFYDCANVKVSITQDVGYTFPYRIPINGTGTMESASSVNNMFVATTGPFTGTPEINKTYYVVNEPIAPPVPPQPEPTPDSSPKDESYEKVIGPTWHWNNDKGICEDYGVVGTYTR